MPRSRSSSSKNNSTANLGFEAKLWLAADKLRSNMDAAESKRSGDSQPKAARRASAVRQYKHTVLGSIFLKYISDSFEEKHAELTKERGADPEDPDEYKAENVFWVPPAARWSYLQNSAKQPPSARSSMTPWSRSSATTSASKASCRKTTPGPVSTNTA